MGCLGEEGGKGSSAGKGTGETARQLFKEELLTRAIVTVY